MKRKCEWKDKHKDYGRSVWIRCENKPPIEGFCESLGVQDFSTIRNSTPKREKERNVFREHNSTIRNSIKRRTNLLQKEILLLISKGPIELKKLVSPGTLNSLGPKYYNSSIYRSINNLLEKNLIKKKRRSEWSGPFEISLR